jgi:hypothetical protein
MLNRKLFTSRTITVSALSRREFSMSAVGRQQFTFLTWSRSANTSENGLDLTFFGTLTSYCRIGSIPYGIGSPGFRNENDREAGGCAKDRDADS